MKKCSICGAAVVDTVKHTSFHRQLLFLVLNGSDGVSTEHALKVAERVHNIRFEAWP